MRISTLKKRAEFQRVRGGGRCSLQALVLEGKPRPVEGPAVPGPGPRFGFTVTKKLGGAVVRNRIRRRLKAAIRELGAECADPSFDYVVVARAQALDMPYAVLCAELATAFRRVKEGAMHGNGGKGRRKPDHSEPRPRQPSPTKAPRK